MNSDSQTLTKTIDTIKKARKKPNQITFQLATQRQKKLKEGLKMLACGLLLSFIAILMLLVETRGGLGMFITAAILGLLLLFGGIGMCVLSLGKILFGDATQISLELTPEKVTLDYRGEDFVHAWAAPTASLEVSEDVLFWKAKSTLLESPVKAFIQEDPQLALAEIQTFEFHPTGLIWNTGTSIKKFLIPQEQAVWLIGEIRSFCQNQKRNV